MFWLYDALQAMDIMKEFPKGSLAERLTGDLSGTNFTAIAEESAVIALNVAYSGEQERKTKPIHVQGRTKPFYLSNL